MGISLAYIPHFNGGLSYRQTHGNLPVPTLFFVNIHGITVKPLKIPIFAARNGMSFYPVMLCYVHKLAAKAALPRLDRK